MWGAGSSSCCLDLALELRNDYPLTARPPGLPCTCCLGQWAPVAVISALNGLSATCFFVPSPSFASCPNPPLHNRLHTCLVYLHIKNANGRSRVVSDLVLSVWPEGEIKPYKLAHGPSPSCNEDSWTEAALCYPIINAPPEEKAPYQKRITSCDS